LRERSRLGGAKKGKLMKGLESSDMNTIVSAGMKNMVYGGNILLNRTSAIFGASVIRGTNTTQVFNAIWGTCAWGTSFSWDTRTAIVGTEAFAINGEQ
jgi:hypothetical protein